jgi:hypothetical protein
MNNTTTKEKLVPFTVSFTSRFVFGENFPESMLKNVPNKELERICKEGLVELFSEKYLPALNEGASYCFIEVEK